MEMREKLTGNAVKETGTSSCRAQKSSLLSRRQSTTSLVTAAAPLARTSMSNTRTLRRSTARSKASPRIPSLLFRIRWLWLTGMTEHPHPDFPNPDFPIHEDPHHAQKEMSKKKPSKEQLKEESK